MEKVVCVNHLDQMIGECEKIEAHRIPVLHRAFSVFVIHESKMLLQQRAYHKYHWGGYWSNACCSHPRSNETLEKAVHRRLIEELGYDMEVEKLFSFIYFAQYSSDCCEYEYDHVFISDNDMTPELNPDEVADMKWIDLDELTEDMLRNPKKYTPWFLSAAPRVINIYQRKQMKHE